MTEQEKAKKYKDNIDKKKFYYDATMGCLDFSFVVLGFCFWIAIFFGIAMFFAPPAIGVLPLLSGFLPLLLGTGVTASTLIVAPLIIAGACCLKARSLSKEAKECKASYEELLNSKKEIEINITRTSPKENITLFVSKYDNVIYKDLIDSYKKYKSNKDKRTKKAKSITYDYNVENKTLVYKRTYFLQNSKIPSFYVQKEFVLDNQKKINIITKLFEKVAPGAQAPTHIPDDMFKKNLEKHHNTIKEERKGLFTSLIKEDKIRFSVLRSS